MRFLMLLWVIALAVGVQRWGTGHDVQAAIIIWGSDALGALALYVTRPDPWS